MPCDPPVHDSSRIGKTSDFEHFWPFSGPGRISMPCDPRYRTLEGSAKLVFLAISNRFVGYNQ